MIDIERVPLGEYVKMLAQNKRLVFTRWGDGEWQLILALRNATKANTDGSNFVPGIRPRLRHALSDNYEACWGMQNMANRHHGEKIEKYMRDRKINKHWVDSDVFHKANCKGLLYPFIRQCQKRRIAYVGPKMLKATMKKIFAVLYYIETPLPNCHKQEDLIRKQLLEICNKVDMICFSAGWMTNIFMHNIVKECEASLIDFGSVFDIYAGKKSRSMFSEKGWDKKIAQNLGEDR